MRPIARRPDHPDLPEALRYWAPPPRTVLRYRMTDAVTGMYPDRDITHEPAQPPSHSPHYTLRYTDL